MSVAFTFDGFVTQSAQAGAPPVADTVPDAFGWATKTGQSLGATVEADTAIVLTGIDADAAFTVSGGTVQINGGSWVSSGTYSPGDTIKPRVAASGSYSTETTVTVTVGGVAGTFTAETYASPKLLSIRARDDGATLEFVWNRAMAAGAGGAGGFTSSGGQTVAYSSGDGGQTWVITSSPALTKGDTISYTQPTNGVEDSDGNDVTSFSGFVVRFPSGDAFLTELSKEVSNEMVMEMAV